MISTMRAAVRTAPALVVLGTWGRQTAQVPLPCAMRTFQHHQARASTGTCFFLPLDGYFKCICIPTGQKGEATIIR